MPVEAGGLVKVVHMGCGGFFRFVQAWEMVSLFIPGCGIIKGYFLAGFYSKFSFGECCPPFFGSLCFSVLKRQDIFYAVFLRAEINAACAVVIACAEGCKSLKQFVQFSADFKTCVCIVALNYFGRVFIFKAPFKIGEIGQHCHSAMSQCAGRCFSAIADD